MPHCREVTEICSAEMERPLRLGERVGLHTHLMLCTGCSRFRKQLKTLRQVMQAYAEGRSVAGEPGADEPGRG